ncbi:MAG: O-antigen ligase family protein, partial [Planctomycetota bacterium]
ALVVGLVLAHGLAAVPVFWEGGERRAAAETVFNWAGLAASAALLRSLRRPGDGVRFAALAVACGTAAAVVGLYQVIVSLPATRTAYLELREQEENGPPDDRAEARAQLSAMGVPDDAAGRKRWEDRLLNSREPFGPYSLANTLAGVLLASVLLLPAVLSNTDRQGLIVGAAAAALLLGVLLLTKSRTGYVGLAVGGLLWAGLIWGRGAETRLKRRIVWGAGIAGGLLALGVGIAVGAGQLDREVISEAPRSLTFRMQYWTGTLRALAERPLLGTGPGNFRSFYLLHKEAAASESIAAPHSLPLDLWSSGGLLAPLFAAALAWSGVNRWRAASEQESAEPAGPPPLNTSGWDPLFTGVLAGFCLVGVFGGWLGSIPRTDAGVPGARRRLGSRRADSAGGDSGRGRALVDGVATGSFAGSCDAADRRRVGGGDGGAGGASSGGRRGGVPRDCGPISSRPGRRPDSEERRRFRVGASVGAGRLHSVCAHRGRRAVVHSAAGAGGGGIAEDRPNRRRRRPEPPWDSGAGDRGGPALGDGADGPCGFLDRPGDRRPAG